MADDRLDDAIDAVVRAVDRIERATRRQPPLADAQAEVETEPHAGEESPAHPAAPLDVRPPAEKVSPGRDAWMPVTGGAGDGAADDTAPLDGRPRKKAKAKKRDRDRERDPDGELHELVGRIVVRTQELDEHLLAARALRDEVSELVARLAAAADHRR